MTSLNIFVIGIFVQLFLQSVLLIKIPVTSDENRIPTVEDEYKQWKASSPFNQDNMDGLKLIKLREKAFQRCVEEKGGVYGAYEDYLKCKPYIDRETQKLLKSNKIPSITPQMYSDEIVKVQSAEAAEYEEGEEDDPYFPVEFIDEPKHLNRRVGFWTKLWQRIIDEPELNPYPLV